MVNFHKGHAVMSRAGKSSDEEHDCCETHTDDKQNKQIHDGPLTPDSNA
ncbi:hypothetical protein BSP239C_03003 [Brevibacterium sp. 239c]|nr:hypothetical protein BSP239C_03003 [Brevibacterium sp. 239c]